MDILIKAGQFILSLSFLIVLHELGHFIPAKLFKTKVEKFYLFFDYKFSLFKKKIGDTVYGIGWIPLGGYVKIAGMVDESMDTDQLKQEPKPWEFRSKPAWQRLIIMLGGVIVNFILGWFIYVCLMWSFGESYLPNEGLKDGIFAQGELAESLGIQTGDKIISIDGVAPRSLRDLPIGFINGNTFIIERNGTQLNKQVPKDFISKAIEKGKNAPAFISYRYPFVIAKVADDSPNINSGLLPKDRVVAIGDTPVTYFDQSKVILDKLKGQQTTLTVLRADQTKKIPVSISKQGKIGVALGGLPVEDLEKLGFLTVARHEYSFIEAIPAGTRKTWSTLTGYIKQLKKVFTPSTGAYKGVGGFISMGSIFPSSFDWQAFWAITAYFSLALGVMNLLPVPGLDGGHVLFTLWEMITGKKPNDKFLEKALLVGFIILMTFILLVNGNDIFKHLIK